MNTKNLTPLQEKLVEELIAEFSKLNPKQSNNEGKRFTFETIKECQNEEMRFFETISKHNLMMIKVFVNQFEAELEEFKKEFGKVLDIQIGHNKYTNGAHGTLENFKNKAIANPKCINDYDEMNLFFVSKTKKYTSDSNYNFCEGKDYLKIYISFKMQKEFVILANGKTVFSHKIIGLEYRTNDYLYKEKCTIKSTLDELIQNEKRIQQKIVELCA